MTLAIATSEGGAIVSKGVELIAAERERQVSAEGWTAEHDAKHGNGELIDAAVCYAMGEPGFWPWEVHWYKPSDDPTRDLVKAGALIAAEIDRLLAVAATVNTYST